MGVRSISCTENICLVFCTFKKSGPYNVCTTGSVGEKKAEAAFSVFLWKVFIPITSYFGSCQETCVIVVVIVVVSIMFREIRAL